LDKHKLVINTEKKLDS